MPDKRRRVHVEPYRHLLESERLAAGYLEPGRFSPAQWQGTTWSEDCTSDVSCYASRNHDDLCPVRSDPFRNDDSLRGVLL